MIHFVQKTPLDHFDLVKLSDILLLSPSTSRHPRHSLLLHQEASKALIRAAKDRIDEEGERPSIATLRGLLLLGSWHSGRGYQGLGNLYAGMGLRMSQTLGLGIDATGFVKNGVLSEELRRTRDYAM